jgi:hypothetical protein
MSLSLIAFQPAIEEPSNMVPFGEELLVDHVDVEGDVLELAPHVGEAKVDVADLLLPDLRQDLLRRHRRLRWGRPRGSTSSP